MSLQDKASIIWPKGAPSKAGFVAAWNPQTGALVNFPVTRATTKTYIDEAGLIQSAATNVLPRDFTFGGCGDFAIEPLRTNIPTNNITPASWSTTLTPTDEGLLELNGTGITFRWGKFTQSGTTNNMLNFGSSVTTGQNWAISLYVKISESGDYIGVREVGNGLGVVRISTQSVTTAGAGVTSCRVVDTINTDIKRVIILGTSGGGGNVFLQLPSSTGDSGVDDGNTLQLAAFQYEVGQYASSVIPTVSSSVTRNADVPALTGVGSLMGNTGGGFFIEFSVFSVASGQSNFISVSDGTGNNRVAIGMAAATLTFNARSGGALQANITNISKTANTFYKAAGRYAVNDFALYVDGTQSGVDTSGLTYGASVLNELVFDGKFSNPFYGRIRQLVYFNEAPTNTQLGLISTP